MFFLVVCSFTLLPKTCRLLRHVSCVSQTFSHANVFKVAILWRETNIYSKMMNRESNHEKCMHNLWISELLFNRKIWINNANFPGKTYARAYFPGKACCKIIILQHCINMICCLKLLICDSNFSVYETVIQWKIWIIYWKFQATSHIYWLLWLIIVGKNFTNLFFLFLP